LFSKKNIKGAHIVFAPCRKLKEHLQIWNIKWLHESFNVMELILFIYLKTKRMKKNWKNVLLYIVRIIELLITGAAGGALGSGL